MNRRRLVLLAITFVIVIGAGVIFCLPQQREPEYKGGKLSEWLGRNGGSRLSTDMRPAAEESADAVRHIGTNALPWLIKWTLYDELGWRHTLHRWQQNLPGGLHDYLPEISDPGVTITLGMRGFSVLGDEAAPAVPVLAQALENRARSPRSRACAAQALYEIGGPGIPPLLKVLSDHKPDDPTGQQIALVHLGRMSLIGTNGLRIVEAVIPYLQETNYWPSAHMAAKALGDLRLEPKASVPALVTEMHHPVPAVRGEAVESVAKFGDAAAQVAVPKLIAMLNDSAPYARECATNALHKIAPEVLNQPAAAATESARQAAP